MALLLDRGQLALARQGERLLEQKRDALLREFHREVRVIYTARDELETAAAAAGLALEDARVRSGESVLGAAAAAAAGEQAEVELHPTVVMGVALPAVTPRDLVRDPAGRHRALRASGLAVERAAERFEQELTLALRLATLEARVRRLAYEIRRTNSRVNALRTLIIPRLELETRTIELALEQRERDDRFRLKLVKTQSARRTTPTLAGGTRISRSGPATQQ
ncbi:MAG: V-type ATP synthase subunit D [Candidatus Limnocylindrales bacterium]|jgi:V/A-type H+-transporting ATPase subunit D